MRLLRDTHTFLWTVKNLDRLSAGARAAIADGGNEKLLSIASLWEIAIKVSLGRLELEVPLHQLLTDVVQQFTIDVLPMKPKHLVLVASLPFHHRDPFDRLLIAQCLSEGISIVSNDAAADAYGVKRIW